MSTCHVVTFRQWIAEELAAGSEISGIDVSHSYGLDIPAYQSGDSWWAPTQWLAHAMCSVDISLCAPGAALLPKLRSDIMMATLGHLPDITVPIFAKVAEAKIENLPASVWPSVQAFAHAARGAGVPDSSAVHLTTTLIDFRVEVRCFVAHGRVLTASTYLVDGHTEGWGIDQWCLDAAGFAQQCIQTLDDQPDGWVIDVGLDQRGTWRVVEANPAFSSSPYDADPVGVLRTLDACSKATSWRWIPDPWITAQVQKKRPLSYRGTRTQPVEHG